MPHSPIDANSESELDQILTRLENYVAGDIAHRILSNSSGTSPRGRHQDAKVAILAWHHQQLEAKTTKPNSIEFDRIKSNDPEADHELDELIDVLDGPPGFVTDLGRLIEAETKEAYQQGYDDRSLEADHELEDAIAEARIDENNMAFLRVMKIGTTQGLSAELLVSYHDKREAEIKAAHLTNQTKDKETV